LPPHAGVRLRFIPDDTIISGWDEYQSTVVGQRLALLAVLTKVPITYTDHQLTAPIHYHYPDGMRNLLVEHLGPQRAMNGMMLYCAQQAPTMHAEVAVHWGETTGLGAWSVVNGYVPADGGTHIRGVWHGLIEGLDQYVRAQGWFSAHAPRLRIAHLPQTLTACIAVQADTIHYGNATKMHVDDPLVRSFLRRVVRTHVVSQFAQQPSIIRAWFEHVDTHNPANT
jgi:DNA gyrase/topoisomerase IV subunit B